MMGGNISILLCIRSLSLSPPLSLFSLTPEYKYKKEFHFFHISMHYKKERFLSLSVYIRSREQEMSTDASSWHDKFRVMSNTIKIIIITTTNNILLCSGRVSFVSC